MERNERPQRMLARMAELFDLPADIVAGLCHVEMLGDRQLFLEGHSGILSYGTEQIDVGAGSLISNPGVQKSSPHDAKPLAAGADPQYSRSFKRDWSCDRDCDGKRSRGFFGRRGASAMGVLASLGFHRSGNYLRCDPPTTSQAGAGLARGAFRGE